jgi:hypothetical protein
MGSSTLCRLEDKKLGWHEELEMLAHEMKANDKLRWNAPKPVT